MASGLGVPVTVPAAVIEVDGAGAGGVNYKYLVEKQNAPQLYGSGARAGDRSCCFLKLIVESMLGTVVVVSGICSGAC